MSLESVIYPVLTGAGTVTAVVSTRIYPTIPLQDVTLPFLVYSRIATENFIALDGVNPLRRYDLSLDYWAVNYDTTNTLAAALQTLLDGYHDTNIQGVFLTEQSTVEEEVYYHGQQTYSVFTAN